MRINTNMRALSAWRSVFHNVRVADRTLETISSGLRVARAADDPSGLGVSERMRAGIRGMNQAMRNIQDGISLVRTADAVLDEMVRLLQRGRELSVQAANTGALTDADRSSLQAEYAHLVSEIDRISTTAEFNGKKLLGGASDERVVTLVESLRKTWLKQSELLVQTYYGLTADSISLKITYDESNATMLAYVSGTPDGSGNDTYTNLELHVVLSQFDNFGLPNGGSPPSYLDQTIAHEMTHAVMMRTTRFATLTNWFVEGTAEFIAGADPRLSADIAAAGGILPVVNEIDSWEGSSADYSSAYAAIKYMHETIIGNGGTGIRDVFDTLNLTLPGGGLTLDAAVASTGLWADANDFVADYKTNGVAFISGLNLTDNLVGNIGNTTAEDAVPDTVDDTWDPLANFGEDWPTLLEATELEPLQIGALPRETLDLTQISINSSSLGVRTLNLARDASGALSQIDSALQSLGSVRSELGALQNRLEYSYNATAVMSENLVASESRIRDADMARSVSDLTRSQILTTSSMAMLVQANNLARAYIIQLTRPAAAVTR